MSDENSTAYNATLKQLAESANGIAVSNLPTNPPTNPPANPSTGLYAQPPPGWPAAGYVMQGPYGPAMQQQQQQQVYQQQQYQQYAHQQQYQPYVHQQQYHPQYQLHPQQYLVNGKVHQYLSVPQPRQPPRVPIQKRNPKADKILKKVLKSADPTPKDPKPKHKGLTPRGGGQSCNPLNSAIRQQMRLQQSMGEQVVVKVEQKTRKHLKRKHDPEDIDSFRDAALVKPSNAAVEAAEIMAKQGPFVLEVDAKLGVSYFDSALEISRNKSATPPEVVDAAADPPAVIKYLQNKAGVTRSASSNSLGHHGRLTTQSSTGTGVSPGPDDTTETATRIAQALVGLGNSNVVIDQPPQNQDENQDYTNDYTNDDD